MNQPAEHIWAQLDGPVLPPSRLGTGRNLGLLVMMLPLLLAPLVWDDPYAPSWSWPLALAGSLVGVLIFSRQPWQTMGQMDWALSAVLAGLMIAVPVYRTAELYLAPIVGFLCGFIVSQPKAAYLLARPGLIAWLALLPTLAATGAFPPVYSDCTSALLPQLNAPTLIYGFFDWPFICVWLMVGFCFATRRTSARYWLLPWLAIVAAAFVLPHRWHGELRMGPPLYRVAALTLPLFFIAPQIARSRLELLAYEIILVLLLFHPSPALGWISDPTLFWSGFIFAPRWYLDRRRRKQPPGTDIPSEPPSGSADQTARIKCGHEGTALQLTEWLGLASCRLAAEHDGGPLLCPYGCLGLGDCQRACPTGAISLESGFPVIDPKRCRGCGRCWSVCPKQLFELHGGEVRAFIPCASPSSLKNNAEYCEKSCLGCGKCRKACPAKAIGRSGDSGAMTVDQSACRAYGDNCGQVCREVCPRKIIKVGL
jgi:Dissimilatory sulfite reductase (desulfoviridin), alpha and beta subunits